MKKMEVDVAVIAGGPAGLAAAITACENDRKTVLFEKSNTTGGAANMGMGVLGIDTKIQRANFNDISFAEAFRSHMEYTHYRVNGPLVSAYFRKSADTVEWLQDMGVVFAGAYRYSKDSAATWHVVMPENGKIGPRAASGMIKVMTNHAIDLGCEIMYETPAYDLIVEDGVVCGVLAKDKNGEEIECRAKAVVVATGGFGSSHEMCKEELGLELGKEMFTFMVPGVVGDGLKMMWKAGAMKYGLNFEVAGGTRAGNFGSIGNAVSQGDLLVNREAIRFMPETGMLNSTYMGNALIDQPDHVAYSITDVSLIKKYKKNGFPHISIVHGPDANEGLLDELKELQTNGCPDTIWMADTIEELAEKIGLDPDTLAETLDEYNDACDCGIDELFAKDVEDLRPITGKGGFIAVECRPGAYGTIGGVKVNAKMQVLDNNCKPIPGLYSAGTDCNTIYGDSYNFTLPGNSMGFAVNSGRLAGDGIEDYLD